MHFRTVSVALALLIPASPAPAQNPLVAAIQDRDLGGLKQLLAENPEWLEWKDRFHDEATPLQEAVYASFKEGVDLLLNRGARLDLFAAAGLGRTRDVEALLKADPPLLRARSRGGWTALHWACWHGRTATVAWLLAHKAPVDGRDGDGRTPLYHAVQNGHLETAALLLKHKAAVNACDRAHLTPLHLAAGAARKEAVRFLLDHGANARARTDREDTPLHVLLDPERFGVPFSVPIRNKDASSVAALLIAHRADLSPDSYIDRPVPGLVALSCNGIEEARKLIVRHSPARDVFQAAFLGELQRVQTLIQKDRQAANATGPQKRTALHWAAEQGHEAVVHFLLSRDATADVRDETEHSPLDLAAARGHLAIVKRLAVAVPGPRGQALRDRALFAAVTAGRKPALETLLECGANLWATREKETLLHHAVLEGKRPLVAWLLARKLSLRAKGKRSQTPLHRAMECGDEPVAELLLRAGADVDAVDHLGRTALDIAATRGCTRLVKLLVRYKARVNPPNARGVTPLYYAAASGQKETVALLLTLKADATVRTADGGTLLNLPYPSKFMFCGNHLFNEDTYFPTGPVDFVETVRLLLKHKADARARTSTGSSAVDYAAASRVSTPVLRLLFDAGATGNANQIAESGRAEHMRQLLRADPSLLRARRGLLLVYLAAAAGNSETAGVLVDALQGADQKRALTEALVAAAHFGHRKLAAALLDRGADVNARDRDGAIALHEAMARDREPVASLLLARGADCRPVNAKKQTALHLAAGLGQEKIVRMLLARGAPVGARDAHGRTALHALFLGETGPHARGPMRVLRLLLRAGANPNARDADGKTPLHLAAAQGDGEAVARLLQGGAAVNITDKKGTLPVDGVPADDAADLAPLLRVSVPGK